MTVLDRLSRLMLVVLLVVAGASGPSKAAEPLPIDEDGWYSWRVASIEDFEEELFYVRVKAGEIKTIRIIGQRCDNWIWNGWPVKRSDREFPEAVDLGLVETDRSIDWFEQFVGEDSELGSDALAAISQHSGERAVGILIDVVESDAPMDVREQAVFWMAQSESEQAFAYLDKLLMLD